MKLINRVSAYLAVLTLAFSAYTCDTTTGPKGGGGQSPEPYSQTIRTGYSANDFLADSNFTTLIVELDYMEGYAPTQDAVDSLKVFLNNRLHKDQIIINQTSIPARGQGPYSISQVRDLEKEYRDLNTTSAESDTLTAYMLVLDGEYQSSNVLGIAYYNTSTAYFGKTLARASSGIGSPSRRKVEATVFNHEFGHLFGLVNIEGSGSEMQNDHQDEQYGHHCDNDRCLMYWAVQTTDFFANLFEGTIPDLDENCIIDLQANGGK